MKEERIVIDEHVMWGRIAREAGSEKHLQARRIVETGVHPTDEMLAEYVNGGLDRLHVREIKAHIAFCGACAEEVLQLRTVAEEIEGRLLEWAAKEAKRSVSTLIESVATEYWEPQWMELQATAEHLPTQAHLFRKDDGDIQIACCWRGQYREKPSYLSIAWKADIASRSEIHARFVHPETRAQLAEVRLGTCLAGEEVFTSDDLGFDPSSDRWAMALIFKEIDA